MKRHSVLENILPLDTFKTVIESTPLVSIDLIVLNSEGKILLGKRLKHPAQGYWFVPRGRILKECINIFMTITFRESILRRIM